MVVAIAIGVSEAPPEIGTGGVGDQGQLGDTSTLWSSYKYMCIGNGQGQQEGLDLTVGTHITLVDDAVSVHAHGCWGNLWAYAWQHRHTVYMYTSPVPGWWHARA